MQKRTNEPPRRLEEEALNPQPAEPNNNERQNSRQIIHETIHTNPLSPTISSPVPNPHAEAKWNAREVKGVSDEEILEFLKSEDAKSAEVYVNGELAYLDKCKLVRAALARYGNAAQPAASAELDAKIIATAFRDRLINALTSLEDCYFSRENIELAAEDVLHSFTAHAPTPPATEKCRTCNGHGMIGGPSYYSPDEGGEPCPDCAPATGQPHQSTPEEDAEAEWLMKRQEAR